MSGPLNHTALAETYKHWRADLLAAFPDIDEQTLQDTLEGETDAVDVIAGLLRAAREDEAMAGALTSIISDNRARKDRLVHRAELRTQAAQALMAAADIRKIEQPDFTASLRVAPPSVVIDYPEAIPMSFCRIKQEPDKPKIKAEFDAGRDVPGARMSNGGETISVRVR